MDEYINRGTAIAKLTALEVSKPNATIVGAKRLLAEINTADVAPVVHGRWIDIVDAAPTVDAEVVVRCKDCVHYDMGVCLKIYSDGNVHPEAWQPRRPEDYCSHGERKEE